MTSVISIYSYLGVLLLFACESTPIYQNKVTLTDHAWPAEELLNFSFQVQDTAQLYDIYLVVNNTQAYPYQNLYITYYLEDATQALCNSELKNYPLFEAKTGKPLGKGWGKVKSHALIVLQGHHFSCPGWYTFKLAQFMRTEALTGLQAVGIKVTHAAKQSGKATS